MWTKTWIIWLCHPQFCRPPSKEGPRSDDTPLRRPGNSHFTKSFRGNEDRKMRQHNGSDKKNNSASCSRSVSLDSTEDNRQVGRTTDEDWRKRKAADRVDFGSDDNESGTRKRWKRLRWVRLENEPGLLGYWPLFFIYLPDSLKPPSFNTPSFPSQCPAASIPPPAHTACEIRLLFSTLKSHRWQITCSWTLLWNLSFG